MCDNQKNKDVETIQTLQNEQKNGLEVLNIPLLIIVMGQKAKLQNKLKQKE